MTGAGGGAGARTVLFICVENSGRSLMAEAIFNSAPPPGWVARSAGTRPAPAAHPRTAEMLREIGIEPPPHPPQELTPSVMDEARLRITMGCLDDASCPARLKQLEVEDWALPDPTTLGDEGFRAVRSQIQERVRRLIRGIRASDRLLGRTPAPT